nr:MAG TPA: hypothetical protein [Caudoviricetes sp.]
MAVTPRKPKCKLLVSAAQKSVARLFPVLPRQWQTNGANYCKFVRVYARKKGKKE